MIVAAALQDVAMASEDSTALTRVITARLGCAAGSPSTVSAGAGVQVTQADGVRTWIVGMPYATDPWLRLDALASCWGQDRSRVLRNLDGTFLLLAIDGDGFHLINDKVSPLTWYWCRQGDEVIASTSLRQWLRAARVPLSIDYRALRHHLYTRSHHFDCCVAAGAAKLLKGQCLGSDGQPRFYYRLPDHIRTAATPDDFFDALRGFVRATLAGRKVAVLASNGFDSRMNILLLTECLDHLDICTLRSDAYSEHRMLEAFLDTIPRRNWRLRHFDYSMAPSSPHYAPRRLHEHADFFLDCFDDLTENKEHLIFAPVLRQLVSEGFDAIITGCMGGDVRRVIPIHVVNHRPDTLDPLGTPRTRELFGVTRTQLHDEYTRTERETPDVPRERTGDGQMNYAWPLYARHGLLHIALPICTAQSMEIYRGIDRLTLPGHGGVNFFREFIQRHAPRAPEIRFDTGIALNAPEETRPWIAGTIDLDYVDGVMRQSGVIDGEVLTLLRETYGRQTPPQDAAQSYLNLWAWFATVNDRRDWFAESLRRMRASDPYLWSPGTARTLTVARRRMVDALALHTFRLLDWRDNRHPMHRAAKAARQTFRRGAYTVGSKSYGLLRSVFDLPPWRDIMRKR